MVAVQGPRQFVAWLPLRVLLFHAKLLFVAARGRDGHGALLPGESFPLPKSLMLYLRAVRANGSNASRKELAHLRRGLIHPSSCKGNSQKLDFGFTEF